MKGLLYSHISVEKREILFEGRITLTVGKVQRRKEIHKVQ